MSFGCLGDGRRRSRKGGRDDEDGLTEGWLINFCVYCTEIVGWMGTGWFPSWVTIHTCIGVAGAVVVWSSNKVPSGHLNTRRQAGSFQVSESACL